MQFTARFWREFIRFIGSSQGLSSVYHPSTNGAVERVNTTVERYLRSYMSYQQMDWVDQLPFAEVAYNNAVHSSTGFAPFWVVHGVDFIPILEYTQGNHSPCQPREWIVCVGCVWGNVKKALVKSEEATKAQADKKRRSHKPFQVGNLVYLSTKYLRLGVSCRKLGPKYLGPFQVRQVINLVAVRLQLPRLLWKVFHSSLLMPVGDSPDRPMNEVPEPVSGDYYEIQEVLDSQICRGLVQYLVCWKGYPITETSWVREADVHAPRLV